MIVRDEQIQPLEGDETDPAALLARTKAAVAEQQRVGREIAELRQYISGLEQRYLGIVNSTPFQMRKSP